MAYKGAFFLSILFVVTTNGLIAQVSKVGRIDSLFTEMTRQDLFSGAVLIARDSTILLSKGYGYADRENNLPCTPDTRFDISTASNIFTATAITYLAQQKKLKFADPVEKYVKGLPQGNKITIHQMLTHSAGLDDFNNAAGFSYKNIRNCTDVMPFMRTLPLTYEPGTECRYSSGDLVVLGAVVERVSGMSFQDYITKTFIQVLDLKNTCFTPYWTLDDSQRQYAIGYGKTDSGYVRKAFDYDNGFVPLSAGGDWSSVTDLYKFDQAVFQGKLINHSYLKKMITPYTMPWENTHFGYIWMITKKGNYTIIGHLGYSSGWNTINNYYPIQQYTVIIMTNLGSVDMDKLTGEVEQILFERD